ncbi:MAG: phytanoyl-CoA dioxygenase family protein [Gammaproteobacteria bacterium]|nr:phytanoyl-CoA dioxygenase family protein [Gammaproteobacteria bacterium]
MTLTSEQIQSFHQQGFLIERKLATRDTCEDMLSVVRSSINPPLAPVEFETDVQYPGSPAERASLGGNTPRRLLHAYTRDRVFRSWSTSETIAGRVRQLLQTDHIELSQNHHNCIMTKHPGFSSSTSWHQDARYWLFDRPELVSVWLALNDENSKNGGLQLIPGSHLETLERGRYDAAFFLRQDLPQNRALIESAISANLSQGDTLFFHSGTFHAAGKNQTDKIKTSLVFTYHAQNNQPLEGTRSANYPDIPCQS